VLTMAGMGKNALQYNQALAMADQILELDYEVGVCVCVCVLRVCAVCGCRVRFAFENALVLLGS